MPSTSCEPGCGCGKHSSMTTEERFWAKVDKADDCWLWTGAVLHGYGYFRLGQKLVRAHRFSYGLVAGPVSEDVELDHRFTCLRRCVNPSHLRPVTHKQNGENRVGLPSSNTSGVRGVSWNKRARRWHAAVGHHGKKIYVGSFRALEEAEQAVIAKRNELYTHNDVDRMAS